MNSDGAIVLDVGNQRLPTPSPVKVMIVDDSLVQRRRLRHALDADPRFIVVGEAAHPLEARALIKALAPDVLILDIEMPHMDGIEFLRRLMRLRPMPVVMLSSLGAKGSSVAIEALILGAVDCLEKSEAIFQVGPMSLVERLWVAAHTQPQARQPPSGARVVHADRSWNGKLVLIGASTGGVEALGRLLSCLPSNAPPILIAQHMPESYLVRFAARLHRQFQGRAALAEHGCRPEVGGIYLAPGGTRNLVMTGSTLPVLSLVEAGKAGTYCPSVDRLFRSGLRFAEGVVAVLLTGMGRDGAEAMLALRQRGADTIVQSEASALVYGMPGAAMRIGAAQSALSIEGIAERILELTMSASGQS